MIGRLFCWKPIDPPHDLESSVQSVSVDISAPLTCLFPSLQFPPTHPPRKPLSMIPSPSYLAPHPSSAILCLSLIFYSLPSPLSLTYRPPIPSFLTHVFHPGPSSISLSLNDIPHLSLCPSNHPSPTFPHPDSSPLFLHYTPSQTHAPCPHIIPRLSFLT
ncbi:hypothetical protein PoB_000198300 [Plakobranchus ocellatus]|uniref:Uncharacterized protein n=1 Tax=Plakobranchus ocellatus TaxID=259542 RepID=A0AAV3XZ43_9GAST|nr:hypothetical protein PoB_000198300 [Plakobranchus ocellatus]